MINVNEKTYKDIVRTVGKDKMMKIEQDSNRSPAQEIVTVQATRMTNTLEQNTAKIIELHNGICDMLVKGLDDALQIGELLFAQKEIVKRDGGLFTGWAKDNLPFSLRTAQRYMRLLHYVDALRQNNIKTLTDAYAHITGEPITDEIIDADDSLETDDIVVEATVDLDTLDLPKKKAKGLMTKYYLSKSNIDDFVSGRAFQGREGRFRKIVVELKCGNIQSKHIGEFVCAAEKYLKPGGKLIFYKR
jgi:hypothetical protein